LNVIRNLQARNSQECSLFAFPKADRVKDDLTVRTALERKPWPEFVLFVDDGDRFVFVGLAVAVDANGYLSLLLRPERLALDESMDELADGKLFALCRADDFFRQVLVSEAERTA